MLNEFILYAALAGAGVYGAAYFVFKDNTISWLVSVVVGLAVIYFFFPDSKSAKTVGDIANNLSLLIQKGIYLIGWGGGSFLVSIVSGRRP